MRHRRWIWGLSLVLTLSASPAVAWWDAGHKIIAAIAFRQLTVDEQQAVQTLLQRHPRWQADFVDWMPEHLPATPHAEQIEWAFMQAAIWPDLARDFDEDDKAKFHRGPWHYVNFPLYLQPGDKAALAGKLTVNVALQPPAEPQPEMNIIQTLELARRQLADPATPAETKGLWLSWVFHLVGDSHQPMHSTAVFSARLFPNGCRGGNSVRVKQRENLHSLWDSLLGERLSYRQARNEALKLLTDPMLTSAGERAAKTLSPELWLRESHAVAESVAYGPEILTPLKAAERAGEKPLVIVLTDDYLQDAGRVARQRVVESGYRLAAVLREVVTAK